MLSFFEWCEATALGQLVRDSTWLFPAIESVHLLGLCLLGGSLLVLDLRMLGMGLTGQSIGELARGTRRWLIASLCIMAATGIPLFLSEAVKCYYNPSFWVKMTTVPIALAFTFLVRGPAAARAGGETSLALRAIGASSVTLWLVVAAAGRWIGFSS